MAKRSNRQKIILSLLLLLAIVVIYFIYRLTDPLDSALMPKCFSYTLFGIKCPGCGTQRALHAICCGDFAAAVRFNPLIILSIPYIIIAFLLEIKSVRARCPKLHKVLLGEKAIWILLALLVIYTLLRNFFDF